MWNCPDEQCGCLRIAASLTWCPMCFKERDDMATTTTGGASNANAVEGETGYVSPEQMAADEAVAAQEAPEAKAADTEVPEAAEAAQTVSEPKLVKADPKPALAKAPVEPAGA